MPTPDLTKFDAAAFVAEIREFMKKHNISTREWARLTNSSTITLPRIASGATGVTVATVAKFQQAMKDYVATKRGKRLIAA